MPLRFDISSPSYNPTQNPLTKLYKPATYMRQFTVPLIAELQRPEGEHERSPISMGIRKPCIEIGET